MRKLDLECVVCCLTVTKIDIATYSILLFIYYSDGEELLVDEKKCVFE